MSIKDLEHYCDNLQVRLVESRKPTSVEDKEHLESLFINSIAQLTRSQFNAR